MAHSYGGTTAIWKRPIPAGSLGWRSLRSYIMLLLGSNCADVQVILKARLDTILFTKNRRNRTLFLHPTSSLRHQRHGCGSHHVLQKACRMSRRQMGATLFIHPGLATLSPITFSLLRSAIQCIRGVRSSR